MEFSTHKKPVKSVGFSISGVFLASGFEDGMVRIHDIQQGTIEYTCKEHTDSVNAVCFYNEFLVRAFLSHRFLS